MVIFFRGELPQETRSARGQAGIDSGFTLIEMLVAMSLTLLMMSAVIAVFATVSESVANRRAVVDMSTQLRHARSVLQDDLANLTCPTFPPVRPESNHGYLEIVEGPRSDIDPSFWLADENDDGEPDPVDGSTDALRLDLSVSQLPSSDLYRLPGSTSDVRQTGAVTDGGGLGDWDDVLMLTARNEREPFVGRVPDLSGTATPNGRGFDAWGSTEIESPLAEVVWFAVENPVEADRSFYFGEPGFRTVYRRVFLIVPSLDLGIVVGGVRAGPGVLRVLPDGLTEGSTTEAAAALVAFQERYDLSVRMEWDPLLAPDGRWVVKANTLADLTKRENRAEHLHVNQGTPNAPPAGGLVRHFPYRSVSSGSGVADSVRPLAQIGPDARQPRMDATDGVALPGIASGNLRLGRALRGGRPSSAFRTDVVVYQINEPMQSRLAYGNRPFVQLDDPNAQQPTTRAVVNELGQIVMFTNGMVPLSGQRRGEDVMLSNMLAFDLKVYDPEAPVLADVSGSGEVVDPGSPAWGVLANGLYGDSAPTGGSPIVRRGAYVDLGYFDLHAYFARRNAGTQSWRTNGLVGRQQLLGDSVLAGPMDPRSGLDPNPIAWGPYRFSPYRTYDTWSTSYENNGIDDDQDGVVDEGTNGFDDPDPTTTGDPNVLEPTDVPRFGVDDPTERETAPPYDTPLRGLQVTLRAYELDSRQIREVNVKQTFVPK